MKTVWKNLRLEPAEWLAELDGEDIATASEYQAHWQQLFRNTCGSTCQHVRAVACHVIAHGSWQKITTSDISRSQAMIEFTLAARHLLAKTSGKQSFNLETFYVAALILHMEQLTEKESDALHFFAHRCLEIQLELMP